MSTRPWMDQGRGNRSDVPMTKATRKRNTAPKRKKATRSAGVIKRKTATKTSTAMTDVGAQMKSPRGNAKQPKSRENTKANEILKLLQRKGGATIAEMQKATGWQPHSVRGFLSGTVKKRLGRNLTSEKASDRVRRYMIGAAN